MATTSSQGEMEIFQTCGKQDRVSNKFSWKQIINTTSQYTFLRETCRMSLLRKEKQASKNEKYGKNPFEWAILEIFAIKTFFCRAT